MFKPFRDLLIIKGMQSEDNITEPLLDQYFQDLRPEFAAICNEVLYPTNPDWTTGKSMWSWANAYMYDAQGRDIAAQNHLYQYGSGCTAWYIFDGSTVTKLDPHKIPVPDCK